MQISRVGAGGRKIIASLQGRLLLVGPGFCRHPGETLAHSARLPRLPKSHLSTGGPPNLSPPGAASRLYLDLGLEVQPTLSKYVCSLGSRTFHLFFPAALYSLQNPLPSPEKFILFFKAQGARIPIPKCHRGDCGTLASSLGSRVSWVPNVAGCRSCMWTFSLLAPVWGL